MAADPHSLTSSTSSNSEGSAVHLQEQYGFAFLARGCTRVLGACGRTPRGRPRSGGVGQIRICPPCSFFNELWAASSSSMRSCLSSSERRTRETSEVATMAAMNSEAILMPSGRL